MGVHFEYFLISLPKKIKKKKNEGSVLDRKIESVIV